MKLWLLNLNNFSLKLNDRPYIFHSNKFFITIFLSITKHTLFKENYDEILHAHYTWKISEKGFKNNWVMP
jgi:hypothetical protein